MNLPFRNYRKTGCLTFSSFTFKTWWFYYLRLDWNLINEKHDKSILANNWCYSSSNINIFQQQKQMLIQYTQLSSLQKSKLLDKLFIWKTNMTLVQHKINKRIASIVKKQLYPYQSHKICTNL